MGIPGLYGTWIRNISRKYRILQKYLPNSISSLSIDMNGLIHTIAQRVYSYGKHENERRTKHIKTLTDKELLIEFFEVLESDFISLIATIKPKDTLLLAFDGPAPFSKIAQQRRRRYKSSLEKGSERFYSASITTGTEFMDKLDKFIRDMLNKYINMMPQKIIYSSPYVNGEGEHKIASFIRSGELTSNGSHVIYALDADLAIITLNSPITNIFIARESISDIINIDNLRLYIKERMGNKSSALADFMYLISLAGNDFIPGLPASRGTFYDFIEQLMKTYRALNLTIVDNEYNINYNNLKKFFNKFSFDEKNLLNIVLHTNFKYPFITLEKNSSKHTVNFDAFRNDWYKEKFLPVNAKKYDLQKYFGVDDKLISETIHEYVLTMSWIFYYYIGHPNLNIRWLYEKLYSPLAFDLKLIDASYLKESTSLLLEKSDFITPIQQLLCVIPPNAKNVIPEELRYLYDTDSPIIYNYPDKFIIDKEGTFSSIEFIALLPTPYFEEIIEVTKEMGIVETEDENIIITKKKNIK